MGRIVIESFQWGQANDKNRGQKWAFWNSKNIDYRRNSQYIELAKKVHTLFSISTTPLAITFWGTGGTLTTDLVVFANGWVYTSAWLQSSLSGILNVAEANSTKFIILDNSLRSYTNPTTNTLISAYTGASVGYRPAIDFGWDLIFWNGNKVVRYNIDGTLMEWTAWTSNPVIWGLDGNIVAITNIWQWVFLWCDGWTATTVYQWDGVSNAWSTFVRYADKSVKNVALLWNMHYWWQSKTTGAIKEVLIWESYRPQVYVKSDYPNLPIEDNPDDEKNKMAITTLWNAYINAIETVGDIVYLPWIGRIFGFGSYFPWDTPSFNIEHTFTGTTVSAMASWGLTGSSSVDAWWILAFWCANGASNYDINVINLGMDIASPAPWYAESWELESMEYLAPNFAKWEQDRKYVIPFELPDDSCSIKIYEKRDRGSYSLVKTLSYSDYQGYNVAEVSTQGTWRTKQYKFELLSSDSTYSPKLYVWFTNLTEDSWKTI